jgi:hypothetical protein
MTAASSYESFEDRHIRPTPARAFRRTWLDGGRFVHTRWLLAALAASTLPLARLAPAPAPAAPTTAAHARADRSAAFTHGAAQSLLRFEPFIGGRWVAEGVLSGGQRYTAERRYEWFMDRRFIRIDQRLTVGEVTVEEESVIGWDPSTNALRFWSFASDGSYAEAREQPATGDNRWIFEGRTTGGRSGDWRMTTLLLDPGSFSVLLEVRDGADYQPLMTLAYRHIPDPPADVPPDTTVQADTTAVRIDTTSVHLLTTRNPYHDDRAARR